MPFCENVKFQKVFFYLLGLSLYHARWGIDILKCKMQMKAYPFPSLVVERACHVDGAGHVLDGERAAYVPARDLVSNTRRCNKINTIIYLFNRLTPFQDYIRVGTYLQIFSVNFPLFIVRDPMKKIYMSVKWRRYIKLARYSTAKRINTETRGKLSVQSLQS